MTEEERLKKADGIALKIISMSGAELLVNMRFLAKALGRLTPRSGGETLSCDGRGIRYSPMYVLSRYKQAERLPVHDHLHMLLHCIFRHWHIGAGVEPRLWDLACDITVEALMLRMELSFIGNENELKKSEVISALSREVNPLTAEKLYSKFRRMPLSEETLDEWSAVFKTDDHSGWHQGAGLEYEPEEQFDMIGMGDPPEDEGEDGDDEQNDSRGNDRRQDDNGDGSDDTRDNGEPDEQPTDVADDSLEQWLDQQRRAENDALDKLWEQIAKEIQSELENFDKGKGDESRHLVQQLEEVNRERYDYTAFLRRFAVRGEIMRADPESFDLGYYSYGMGLYGNVALIEPLEYREVKLVREFVVAIDTSGSVSGKTVQSFIRKTYSILKSSESFFTKVNIYIIQCDTEVREAVRITCEADFEKYIQTMEIRGLGGTDFRPVFEYVDRLIESHELTALKGLIYFTDGIGDFPEKKPPYDTAFAFLREDYDRNSQPQVPPWAIKLILDEEDINNGLRDGR